MKKSVRILAVVMAALMLCLCLASCGKKLSGTYVYEESDSLKLTFKGNKVTFTISFMGESADIEGTYEIKDDKITFDFTGADDEDGLLSSMVDEMSEALDFEKGNGYIMIDGEKYVKE